MSRALVLCVLVCAPLAALADAKLDELKTFYKKEASGCARSRDGLAKVVEGGTALAKVTPDSELAKDVALVAKGHEIVQGYCAELDGVVAVLEANPTAKYKALEKELDERDNRIRKARAASKKIIAEIEPVNRRLIPKINAARVAGPPPTEKRVPAKFPSGRSIELPTTLPGTWKVGGSAAIDTVEYAAKGVTASISTRSFAHATCEQQRKMATTANDTGIVDVTVAADAKLAWMIGFTRKGHVMQLGCAVIGDGGIVAISDLAGADVKLTSEAAKLLLRMTAARL